MKLSMMVGTALMLASGSADAAITVTDYAFTNSFAVGLYPTLSGTFSLSHDSDSGAYALTALHYEIEGFTHDLSNSSLWSYSDGDHDFVVLYGNLNDRTSLYHTHDFDFVFAVGGSDDQVSSVYSTPTSYVIPTNTAILTQVSAPPIPEPASWAMMTAGVVLAGAMLRQRRRTVHFAF